MGREANLRAEAAPTEATALGEGDTVRALAEALDRLAAEADLVERLLSHIAEQHDQARARRERLERCCARMDEADRASGEVLLAAEAAAIESRLVRLQVAASLAKAFARLRASEAESLKDEGMRALDGGAANSAASRSASSVPPRPNRLPLRDRPTDLAMRSRLRGSCGGSQQAK